MIKKDNILKTMKEKQEQNKEKKRLIWNSVFIYGTSLLSTSLAALFFYLKGYPKVNTAHGSLNTRVPSIYMIPIFIPLGILIGEFFWIFLREKGYKSAFILFLECLSLGILSLLRILIAIPYSGHSLILSFYLCYYLIPNKKRDYIKVIIGFLILIITIYYKFFLWNDPITFFLGVLLGIILWIPGFLCRKRYVKNEESLLKT